MDSPRGGAAVPLDPFAVGDRSAGTTRDEFWRFLGVKLSGAAVSLALVLFSAFFIFRIIGGDPVKAVGGESPMTCCGDVCPTPCC